MLQSVISKNGLVKACGSCAEARSLKDLQLIDGVEISIMSQLTQWTIESEIIISF